MNHYFQKAVDEFRKRIEAGKFDRLTDDIACLALEITVNDQGPIGTPHLPCRA